MPSRFVPGEPRPDAILQRAEFIPPPIGIYAIDSGLGDEFFVVFTTTDDHAPAALNCGNTPRNPNYRCRNGPRPRPSPRWKPRRAPGARLPGAGATRNASTPARDGLRRNG